MVWCRRIGRLLFAFSRNTIGIVLILFSFLATGCAGIDPDRYNAPYVSAVKGTDINTAVAYAVDQRERYIKAASSLEVPLLGGGAGNIGLGGAMAGAGAAGVGGSTVSALGAGTATLAGVGEFFKPSDRAKIFITAKTAIQCSLDVVLSTFAEAVPGGANIYRLARSGPPVGAAAAPGGSGGSTWDRLTNAKASLQTVAGSMSRWGVAPAGTKDSLMSIAESGLAQEMAKSPQKADAILSQALAAVTMAAQQRSIADETASIARDLMTVAENREKAKVDAPTRVIMAVNAIRGKVDEALKGLIPSIADIKKAADAALSGTGAGDKAKVDNAKDKAEKSLLKLDTLSLSASAVPPKGVAGFPVDTLSPRGFAALKTANETTKKAAEAVDDTIEREIPGCAFDLTKAGKDQGAKKEGEK